MKIIVKSLITIVIVGILSLLASSFYLEAMKKNAGIFTFGKNEIGKVSNSVDGVSLRIYNKKNEFYYHGNIKSAFIDVDKLYVLYYFPFYVFSSDNKQSSKYISMYNKYILNKNKEDFSQDPYYIIYNKKSNSFTFLNAEKKIIDGENSEVNFNNLLKLDSSNTINIDNIYIETQFDLSNEKNLEYKNLLQRLNNHLNVHTKK